MLFPACQVMFVGFYVSCPVAFFSSSSASSARPQLQALDRSVPPPGPNSKPRIKAFPPGPNRKLRVRAFPAGTSTASARLQRSPPDPNSKLTIRVFPAEPQLQALDHSVPRRTQTASPASEWCLPDLNCKRYRSQRSPPDPNSKLKIRVCPAGPDLQALDRRIRVFFAGPQLQALDRSVPGRTRTASPGSEWSLPDLNRKESPKICQIECQEECQKICQIECQKECQNICQKVCQNRCQVECQKGCQSICLKE